MCDGDPDLDHGKDDSGDSMIQPHSELGFPANFSQLGAICDSCFGS